MRYNFMFPSSKCVTQNSRVCHQVCVDGRVYIDIVYNAVPDQICSK